MNIECPHCAKTNSIEFSDHIVCHSCKKAFTGFSFRKSKKKVIPATAMILLSGFTGYKLDKTQLTHHRYPLNVEYEILDICVNSSNLGLSVQSYQSKKKMCLCATEKTINEYTYAELLINGEKFFQKLKVNAPLCK